MSSEKKVFQIRDDMGKFFLHQLTIGQHRGVLSPSPVWIPATDVLETKTSFLLRVELPGVTQEDINVELEGSRLSIKGTRSEPSFDGIESYYQVEIHYGHFERIIILPEGIDNESIRAEYDNGFLLITLAKRNN